jgi:hypothetical protein
MSGFRKAPPSTGSFPQFSVSEGQVDRHATETFVRSGARLCTLDKPELCFTMPSGPDRNCPEFGMSPQGQRVSLNDKSWVLFAAACSNGGSGSITRLALLDRQGTGGDERVVNLFPLIELSELSEYDMWVVPGGGQYLALVDADVIWGAGEVHYDRHFFTIGVWAFDAAQNTYRKVASYRTAKKYDKEDAGHEVLASERANILSRLGGRTGDTAQTAHDRGNASTDAVHEPVARAPVGTQSYRGMYIGEPIVDTKKQCFSLPTAAITALLKDDLPEACSLTGGDQVRQIFDFVRGSESQVYASLVARYGNPAPGRYRMIDTEAVPEWLLWKNPDGTLIAARRDQGSYRNQKTVFFVDIMVFKR